MSLSKGPDSSVNRAWRREFRHHGGLIAKFDIRRGATLAELRAFLAGSAGHDFEPVSRRTAYRFIRELRRRFPYDRLGRADRGVVRAATAGSCSNRRARA